MQNNVRVSRNRTAKLIDFGVGKIQDVKGFTTVLDRNARYTAPELLPIDEARDNDTVRPTFKSDMFSFSLLLLQVSQIYNGLHRNY